MKRIFLKAGALALALCLLGGCGRAGPSAPSAGPGGASLPAGSSGPQEGTPPASLPAAPVQPCFFDILCDEALRKAGVAEDTGAFEKVRLAYLYVIAGTHYIPLVSETLAASWRGLDSCPDAPTVYQAEALGPLYYGLGSCENYSAALMVLLQHMGFDALYVSGLTYSVQGVMVDHAWVMVKVDGTWYHIDPQLEDNVMRDGVVRWHYCLKSDAEFAAHHIWGAALEGADAYALGLPVCPVSAAVPQGAAVEKAARPDMAAAVEIARALAEAGGENDARQIDAALPPLPRDMQPAGQAE